MQRFWADSMAMCSAVRCLGLENVSAMTPTQRAILLMAKDSLRDHLDVVLAEPRLYLHNLRYAADFVWAKNAFCLLLLLKLAILLPDNDGQGGGPATDRYELVGKSRALLAELAQSAGASGPGTAGSGRSNTSSLYLHLVRVSIDKYSRALEENPVRIFAVF